MIPVPQTVPGSTPWNKGQLIGQKPPLKLREIWAIRIRLQLKKDPRELALFNLAIDSKLRRLISFTSGYEMSIMAMGLLREPWCCNRKHNSPFNLRSQNKPEKPSPTGLATIISVQTTIFFRVASIVLIIYPRDSMPGSFTSGSR